MTQTKMETCDWSDSFWIMTIKYAIYTGFNEYHDQVSSILLPLKGRMSFWKSRDFL